MGDDRVSRPDRDLAYGVLRTDNDEIEGYVFEFLPRLRASIGGVDLIQLLEYAEHVRIDARLRLYTGTVGGKFPFTEFANKILRENAAGAVPRAEEKNFQRWGCHGELRLGGLAWQTDIVKASLYENGELKNDR